MAELVASGRIVDFVLAFTLAEGLLLIAIHRRTGRGPAPGSLVANLMAGVCLLLALRAALMEASWVWIAAALLGSLLAHAADLATRWRSPPPRPDPV